MNIWVVAIRIEQNVDIRLLVPTVHLECQGAALSGPVGIANLGAVPAHALDELLPAHREVIFAQRDQQPREAQEAGILLCQRPIDPGDLVVLAIRIVVALLGPAELIALSQERHALRNHEQSQEVAHLPLPQCVDAGVIGRTFVAAVGAEIFVPAVFVVFAVRLRYACGRS